MDKMSKMQLIEWIMSEVKLQAIHAILTDIHNYDGRFDVPHVVHLEDIVCQIGKAAPSERFIEDVMEHFKII
jgi:ubiquinone biosynthesis protein Coq4